MSVTGIQATGLIRDVRSTAKSAALFGFDVASTVMPAALTGTPGARERRKPSGAAERRLSRLLDMFEKRSLTQDARPICRGQYL
jgi:hypothetical protein